MRYLIAFLLLFSTASFAAKDAGQPKNIDSVTVLASSSMTVPIAETSKLYSRNYNVDVNAVFESSTELYNKIEDGDPADIIVTPDKNLLAQLKEHGLIDSTSKIIIAGNHLVIVTAKDMKFVTDKTDAKDILNEIYNKTIMTISDTNTTSLGFFTRQALQKMGLWQKFERRVQLGPTSSKTTDLIIKGQSAGVVYATDAELYKDKINLLATIPDTMHDPVEYYAAVVVGDNMDKARKYLEYLSSDEAKQIFKMRGFVVK